VIVTGVHCREEEHQPRLSPGCKVKLAYHTGMRPGEILNLTWGQVDVREGLIKLEAWNTKTSAPRLVPLTLELLEMFKAMPRGLPAVKVFTYAGTGKSEP
jgi:integrase